MYYIGYDIGSSSIKVALVNMSDGTSISVIQEPQQEMSILAIKNGWAEQDPMDWWEHVCNATKRLISQNNIDAKDIKGIGIAYQMHGLVLVDENGNSLRKSIIWCDGRAVTIGKNAYKDIGEHVCDTHLLNSPANFTASKLKWVKENEPEIYAKTYRFLLPGDFIALKFSGQFNTTVSGLSEGILWNFKNQVVSQEILNHFGFDENLVPKTVKTFGDQGTVNKGASVASGLAEGTPILYRAGDQPNNALSLNVFNPGEVAATGGTSGVVYAVTESLSSKENTRVNNFAHVNYLTKKPRIGKLLCINGAGILYRWLLNNFDVSSYSEMNDLADQVPVGADGIKLIPFGNGPERILDNRDLGMHMANINLNNHTKAHICRAALEGIAFSFVYGMEILKSDGIEVKVIRAGNDNLFRSEIFSKTIATLIGHEIEIYNTTGAIGAARAAGLHLKDFEEFGKNVLENDHVMTFVPLKNKEAYQEAYNNWKKELTTLLKYK